MRSSVVTIAAEKDGRRATAKPTAGWFNSRWSLIFTAFVAAAPNLGAFVQLARGAEPGWQSLPPREAAAPLAKLLSVADHLLDEAQVSYVYGGYQLGDPAGCRSCNACLSKLAPTPAQRLKSCPVCASCSLDCSHFTELVFRDAGYGYPYLDTAGMRDLSGEALRKRYHFVDLGSDPGQARAGDLLVYDGHVVLLEAVHAPVTPATASQGQRGDIIHATGGKDIRRPGEGIQRERFVTLGNFRGPLLRILRQQVLVLGNGDERALPEAPKAGPAPGRVRLRPVEKRDGEGVE